MVGHHTSVHLSHVSALYAGKPSVIVHALSGGHFSLPDYQFVHPVVADARRTVPSLAFLIQHHNPTSGKETKILFEIYMVGDACHDRRLLTGEKIIRECSEADGLVCCVHAYRKQAEETIDRVRRLETQGVEIIFSYDMEWESHAANRSRLFGAKEG